MLERKIKFKDSTYYFYGTTDLDKTAYRQIALFVEDSFAVRVS